MHNVKHVELNKTY